MNRLKIWQKIELLGSFLILFSLLFQFFLATNIEENFKKSESFLMETRLTYLYRLIKDGEEVGPPWFQLNEYYGAKEVDGDLHWSFRETYEFFKPLSLFVFIAGSAFLLVGKVLEYHESNKPKKQGVE